MLAQLKIKHLFFLLPVLSFGLMSCSSPARTTTPQGKDVIKSMTAFVGGLFEASGVADVAGTDGVLFVDNGRTGQVFWMSLDQNGKQIGAIKTIGLGINIEDVEGIT